MTSRQRPDGLLLCVDDMNDQVCVLTPSIDRLAASGSAPIAQFDHGTLGGSVSSTATVVADVFSRSSTTSTT